MSLNTRRYNLDGDAALKVKRKFDIAYLIAKHNLAFTKMGPLLNCNFFSDSVNHC